MMSVVLAIPDTHCPFQHRDAFSFLGEIKKKYRPTDVVHLGDEADLHSLSFHDHDPDGLSPGDELSAAVEALQPLYKMFPNCRVCLSNHTSRPFRRAAHFGIPLAFLRTYREFLRAPDGWWWEPRFTIDGVDYQHGDPYGGPTAALKLALDRMGNVVIGHVHAHASICWARNAKALVFGFNVGWLGDQDSYAMAYAKNIEKKGVLGCGIIRDGIPMFIPMTLRPGGRWTGDI